jgi:hypothetical protein
MHSLTPQTRKFIVDNYNNLRIIHVINRQILPFGTPPAALFTGFGLLTQTKPPSDSYIICGNSKSMSIKRVELSTYDLSFGKYVNLTSLTPEQMLDYDMSFDYLDYSDYSDYVDSKSKRSRVETAQTETLPSQKKKLNKWLAQRNGNLTVSDVGVIYSTNKS